jgi:hypothetical protein
VDDRVRATNKGKRWYKHEVTGLNSDDGEGYLQRRRPARRSDGMLDLAPHLKGTLQVVDWPIRNDVVEAASDRFALAIPDPGVMVTGGTPGDGQNGADDGADVNARGDGRPRRSDRA